MEITICVKEPENTLEKARPQIQPVRSYQKQWSGKKMYSLARQNKIYQGWISLELTTIALEKYTKVV